MLKLLFRTRKEESEDVEIVGQIKDNTPKMSIISLLSRLSGSKKVITNDGDFISDGPKGRVETIDKDLFFDQYKD